MNSLLQKRLDLKLAVSLFVILVVIICFAGVLIAIAYVPFLKERIKKENR